VILHPLSFDSSKSPALADRGERGCAPISAWEAVEQRQKQAAEEWWLIAQPDHAALAGDLAIRLAASFLPKLDDDVVHAIALHDAGWARFDGGERGTGRDLEVSLRDPLLNDSGRPVSFLEVAPTDYVVAWNDSIGRAAECSAIGGIIVSEHFSRIAKNKIASPGKDDVACLHDFLSRECARREDLSSHDRRSPDEVQVLVDVLQFCDLMSLYLCSGSQASVVFPQQFEGGTIKLQCNDGLFKTEPQVFQSGASLGVTARGYPRFGAVEVTTLGFLVE